MEELKNIKVALLGSGTVGTGVYKLIERQREELPHKVGAGLTVSKVLVRDKNKKREGIDPSVLTDQWEDIITDDEIQIVVEVMGGIEPARTYITEALQAGKNVVTANKDLMAVHGGELLDIASHNGCDLLFEASVAGGIPIIRPLKQCLAGNYISEAMGIVNGTTNFILTKMTHEGMEFDEALALATELGYAEAMGCTIKLLGVAKNTESGIEVRVHPMLIPSDHPLATVNDSFNAVFVHGDAVDDAMFYGRGAGEFPTASAVMGDIIDVARNIQFYCTGRIHCTCYKDLPIKKITEIESKYFMRLLVDDKPGVLARIADTLGKNQVSIAQVIQKNKVNDMAELVVITDLVLEQNFADALVEIKGMEHTREISTVIRVY